ncbi:MAG: hypothetical protein ACFFB0_13355 [Promethearchaeota archaeon]
MEEIADIGLKKILIVCIVIFVIGVVPLIYIITALPPYFAIMDSGIRFLYILSITSCILIIILGARGIILYFIAPDKLKKYFKWVLRLLPS